MIGFLLADPSIIKSHFNCLIQQKKKEKKARMNGLAMQSESKFYFCLG